MYHHHPDSLEKTSGALYCKINQHPAEPVIKHVAFGRSESPSACNWGGGGTSGSELQRSAPTDTFHSSMTQTLKTLTTQDQKEQSDADFPKTRRGSTSCLIIGVTNPPTVRLFCHKAPGANESLHVHGNRKEREGISG